MPTNTFVIGNYYHGRKLKYETIHPGSIRYTGTIVELITVSENSDFPHSKDVF